MYNNKKQKEKLIEKIENKLFLLGIIAIEDALQDNVKETLDVFINTGIKIWMLTGDQKLTAESIAKSCKLITEEFHVNTISDDFDDKKIQKELEEALLNLENKNHLKQSLVIGTNAMNVILINKLLTQKVFYFEN